MRLTTQVSGIGSLSLLLTFVLGAQKNRDGSFLGPTTYVLVEK